MKPTLFSTAFSLASWFALSLADVALNSFPDVVTVGGTYTVSWTATANYTYTLWLVLNDAVDDTNNYDWTKVSTLGTGLDFNSLKGSYTWTVPSNLSTESTYAVWLDAFEIPFNGASYSTMTAWFNVTASSNSPAESGTASPTPDASSAPGGTSSGSDQHHALSAGAIAGIVIGCLAAIALAIGAVLLFIRRRRQSGIRSREAEARANRLAPVMKTDFPGYEMHSGTPSANQVRGSSR